MTRCRPWDAGLGLDSKVDVSLTVYEVLTVESAAMASFLVTSLEVNIREMRCLSPRLLGNLDSSTRSPPCTFKLNIVCFYHVTASVVFRVGVTVL